MKKQIVKELNAFLKGNYMAIESYERFLEKINEPEIRKIFQKIKANQEEHAKLVQERIRNLGGEPVDSSGIIGDMVDWMDQFKLETKELPHIIKDAQTGEFRGIKKSKEMLENDLDEESLSLVQNILEKDEEHVALLTELLKSLP